MKLDIEANLVGVEFIDGDNPLEYISNFRNVKKCSGLLSGSIEGSLDIHVLKSDVGDNTFSSVPQVENDYIFEIEDYEADSYSKINQFGHCFGRLYKEKLNGDYIVYDFCTQSGSTIMLSLPKDINPGFTLLSYYTFDWKVKE